MKPRRADFATERAWKTWKATGAATAAPWQRAGYASHYAYKKSQSTIKRAGSRKPVSPKVTLKTALGVKDDIRTGAVPRVLIRDRQATGKSPKYSVTFRVTFLSNHPTRFFSFKFPAPLPKADVLIEEARSRIESPEIWSSYYGTKSDPEDEGVEVDTIKITDVVKPAARYGSR